MTIYKDIFDELRTELRTELLESLVWKEQCDKIEHLTIETMYLFISFH